MSTPADLKTSLDQLGLGFLFPLLDALVKDPSVDAKDIDAVGKYIQQSPDSNIQNSIKQRFIGNEGRVAAGRQPLTPKEYIQAEQTYVDRLKRNGMPQGFYDQPADLAKLIAGNVDAIEFDNRIQQGYKAALAAPQSVKQQLQDLYGVTDSDMAAYFLDPTRAKDVMGREKNATLFNRQIEAARISAQGQTQAGIQLGVSTAEDLAAQGISEARAQEAFTEIGAQQELYNPLQGEQAITQAEQIGGVLGTNAAARQAIAKRRASRVASFQTGGGFTTGQTGTSSLGTIGQ